MPKGIMYITVVCTHEYPLREKMVEKGFTIRSLAKASGVNYTFISRLLSGKSRASTLVADKIRCALGEHIVPVNEEQK